MSAVVAGLGGWLPPRVVTNDELARHLDTSDEWVRTRTGIAQRHIADPSVATSDLAYEACARALKSAGSSDVDVVIVATTTPDHICPGTAPAVAARLGLSRTAAFDLNAACSGFVYGLAVASGLIDSGVAGRVLLCGAETLSRIVDPQSRDTAVLFGDGAGAVVLEPGDGDGPGAIGPFDLGSDGDLLDVLMVPAGGSRRPADETSVGERAHYLRMEGREVYREAVAGMVASARRVLARAGLAAEHVDRLIGHQANARILEAVARRLGIPPERCVVTIDRHGNTSAASIPLALVDAAAGNGGDPLRPGERVLLTAFGAGLSWGSVLLSWPDM